MAQGDSSQDESNYILVARLDNARNLSSILKTVNFKDQEVGHRMPL
jgi:hypothetical protein